MEFKKLLNNHGIMFYDTYIEQYPEGSYEREILRIFSYLNWSDYLGYEEKVPEEFQLKNNPKAAKKLKKLTLMTVFQQGGTKSFDELSKIIDEESSQLQNIICEAISEGLIFGKIDELRKEVKCSRAASRCIMNTPESIQAITDGINKFIERIDNAINL